MLKSKNLKQSLGLFLFLTLASNSFGSEPDLISSVAAAKLGECGPLFEPNGRVIIPATKAQYLNAGTSFPFDPLHVLSGHSILDLLSDPSRVTRNVDGIQGLTEINVSDIITPTVGRAVINGLKQTPGYLTYSNGFHVQTHGFGFEAMPLFETPDRYEKGNPSEFLFAPGYGLRGDKPINPQVFPYFKRILDNHGFMTMARWAGALMPRSPLLITAHFGQVGDHAFPHVDDSNFTMALNVFGKGTIAIDSAGRIQRILGPGRIWIFSGKYQQSVAGVRHGSPIRILRQRSGVDGFRVTLFAFADYQMDRRDIEEIRGMPVVNQYFVNPPAGVPSPKMIESVLRKAGVSRGQDVRVAP